jgi:catechol 2,3-dioxygenase-like lactoylglutathione lyase family enzyme
MNLNQVTIYSSKPAESIEFYKKLGLRLIVESQPRYVRFVCPDNKSTLSIHETFDDCVGSQIVLYFECQELDEEVARLKNIGLVFESEPIDQTWLWREAYLIDPTGNRICLFFAGDNRLNPPWRVK